MKRGEGAGGRDGAGVQTEPPALDAASKVPSIRVGEVVFTSERITLMRSGQLVTAVRRDALDAVGIVNGPVSVHSRRELVWGALALCIGIANGASSLGAAEKSVGSILGSAAALLFGVLLLYSATAKTTWIQMSGANGRASMDLGKLFRPDEIEALKDQLAEELGYPVDGMPPPAKRKPATKRKQAAKEPGAEDAKATPGS